MFRIPPKIWHSLAKKGLFNKLIIVILCFTSAGLTSNAYGANTDSDPDDLNYYLAAFMLKAYIICDGNNYDKCGFASWIEFEPVRYQYESKTACMEAAEAYQKQYRSMHKKRMNIVYTIAACPGYRYEIEPQAFEGSDIG